MSELKWFSVKVALAIHEHQIMEHGGASGVRDQGMLESAVARPINLYPYASASMPRLAATYAAGVVQNHPFVDGNKRTGFLLAYTFLRLNGFDFNAPETDVVQVVLSLAAGSLSEEELGAWIISHSRRVDPRAH